MGKSYESFSGKLAGKTSVPESTRSYLERLCRIKNNVPEDISDNDPTFKQMVVLEALSMKLKNQLARTTDPQTILASIEKGVNAIAIQGTREAGKIHDQYENRFQPQKDQAVMLEDQNKKIAKEIETFIRTKDDDLDEIVELLSREGVSDKIQNLINKIKSNEQLIATEINKFDQDKKRFVDSLESFKREIHNTVKRLQSDITYRPPTAKVSQEGGATP